MVSLLRSFSARARVRRAAALHCPTPDIDQPRPANPNFYRLNRTLISAERSGILCRQCWSRTSHWRSEPTGTRRRFFSFSFMVKKQPIKVEVLEEGDERFLLNVYADGSEERQPIVKEPRKKRRLSSKIAWYWDLKTGRRKFY